jgi:hypothetical protein
VDIAKLGDDIATNLEGVLDYIAFLHYAEDTAMVAEHRDEINAMLAAAERCITVQEHTPRNGGHSFHSR